MSTILVAHPSPDVYGSDRQLLESIDALRSAGKDVIVCLPRDGPLVELLDGVDVRMRRFPVLRKALLRPRALLELIGSAPLDLVRLVRLIRAVRPDVVYVNTVTIPLWVLAARLARRPVLVHVHEAEEGAGRAIRMAMTAPLLLAAVVVANSNASRRALVDVIALLRRRIMVVPNGIKDAGPSPLEAARSERVALVARLSPRKGIDVALEAVARLRRQGRGVELEICGTVFPGYEWYEAELRSRADQADLAGAVRFSGYVNPTAPVLAAARVVVVPSRVEPFGNTAVEGLLAGRPVVASNVQGLAEIVEDGRTGLLVAPDDPDALADAIGRLLDDPALAGQLAAAGRADALERFSIDRYRSEIVRAVTEAGRA
ncbi:MAG: glycosyl transferase family protein [Pseudonocardiales bacterium]|nr:glycosyl transferase family protein [Pseudonocardiales bacterium]